MGIRDVAATWWPVVLLLGVCGGVALAFARCAVAEAVARTAAHLYGSTSEDRARWREEWLRSIEDMKASERPAEAGSLLWVGMRDAAVRRVTKRHRSRSTSDPLPSGTWIRATCNACGEDVELGTNDVIVRSLRGPEPDVGWYWILPTATTAGTYEFVCPNCATRAVQPADSSAILELVGSGVRALNEKGVDWPTALVRGLIATHQEGRFNDATE